MQITPSFGLFNGGFGFYHGAQQAGLFVIPTGAGNTPRQIKLMKDFSTRVLTGVVSYGVRIMEVLAEQKESLPDLKIGMFGAEAFSESMKKKLAGALGIEVFDIYGMTETGGVGTLGLDCCAHDGIHVWEDHYIVEVVDLEIGGPVPDGQIGELVVTALTRQALPVIRFKTGDLTRIVSRKRCACGRTHVRIAPITGRVDDMLIVKGVNFFPKQVEQALMAIPGAGSNYQIIIEETDGVTECESTSRPARGHRLHGREGPEGGPGLLAQGRRLPDRGPAPPGRQSFAFYQENRYEVELVVSRAVREFGGCPMALAVGDTNSVANSLPHR